MTYYDILLVDNEIAILDGLCHGIDWERASSRVTATARDGHEAINLLTNQHFDIVISDIRMPEMDGLELAEWVYKNCASTKVIILTGFPDFEYAQRAINFRVVDFVLKPTSEDNLISALEKAKLLIDEEKTHKLVKRNLETETEKGRQLKRNILFYDLIFNSKFAASNMIHRIEELGLNFSSYYVIRVGVYTKLGLTDYSSYIKQTQEVLNENFQGFTLDYVLKADRFFYAVLSAAIGSNPEAICKKSVEHISDHTDFLITIGISHRYENPLLMSKAALEADNAQMFAEYNEQIAVMSIERIPELTDEASHYISTELKILESAIEHQSSQCAEKSTKKIFQYIRSQHIPSSSVQQLSAIIYSFCNGILLNYNFSEKMSDTNLGSIDPLSTSGSIDDIEKQLEVQIYYVLDRIGKSPTNIDSIVHTTKIYIDQNYNTELSLEALASKVHLSASYLSRLFKKEIGQNLSAYIQTVRIEHAKVLLRSTMLKTYEVAEAVGICDPVYFSKTFKKATGVKPKDYRSNDHLPE